MTSDMIYMLPLYIINNQTELVDSQQNIHTMYDT